MYFDNNIIIKLDCRNLYYCRYLNLRHSSYTDIQIELLVSLVCIDISFSLLNNCDFCGCIILEQVVIDNQQRVKVNDSVNVQKILCIRAFEGMETVSLGTAQNIKVGENDIEFAENMV